MDPDKANGRNKGQKESGADLSRGSVDVFNFALPFRAPEGKWKESDFGEWPQIWDDSHLWFARISFVIMYY